MGEIFKDDLEAIKEINFINKNTGEDVFLKENVFPTENNDIEWRKACKLSLPALPQGVESIIVKRTESEMTGVGVVTWVAEKTERQVEVRYGDTLSVTAREKAGYSKPSVSSPTVKVKSDIEKIVVRGGSILEIVTCAGCGAAGYHYCSACAKYHYAEEGCSGGADTGICPECGLPGYHFCECCKTEHGSAGC